MDCTFENFALAELLENWILSTIWPRLACFRTPLLLRNWWARHKSKNVKRALVQALRLCTGRTTHRGSRGVALLFLDHGTRRSEGSTSCPGCSLPQGKTQYRLYRRLGGPQGRSGQVRKLVPTRIRWWARHAQQVYVCWIMGPSLHTYHSVYPCNRSILVDL